MFNRVRVMVLGAILVVLALLTQATPVDVDGDTIVGPHEVIDLAERVGRAPRSRWVARNLGKLTERTSSITPVTSASGPPVRPAGSRFSRKTDWPSRDTTPF